MAGYFIPKADRYMKEDRKNAPKKPFIIKIVLKYPLKILLKRDTDAR